MADLKISQLTDGGASQATDEYVVARSGANYRIDGASVAAAATSVGTLSSLTVSGDLTVDTSTLKVDSTNNVVGIGTASPGSTFGLDVQKSIANGAVANFQSTNTSAVNTGIAIRSSASNAANRNWAILANTTAYGDLVIRTSTTNGGDPVSGTDRLYIDASGNLGLGVTPSAKLDVSGDIHSTTKIAIGTATNGTTGQFATDGTNTYLDYKGPLYFRTAAASSTTMTLDASGNLGIGTTSPGGRLHMVNSSGCTLRMVRTSNRFDLIADNDFLDINARDSGTYIRFLTVDTERARITAAGLFQVTADGANNTFTNSGQIALKNTGSSPYISWHESTGARIGYLQMTGSGNANLYVEANQPLVFATNNTERARITAGGYFKASDNGTYVSSTASFHEFNQSANNNTVILDSTNASMTSTVCLLRAARNTTNNTFYAYEYYNTGAGAPKFLVADSGNVTNTNGTYGTISDERLKQDIVDAGSQWDDLKAIRFRKFRMKSDVEANPDAPFMLGVVAQEVQAVSPGLVEAHPDIEQVEVTDEDGNVTTETRPTGTETLSVKSSILLMKAAVALQEAMARIEALEARLEALEA